MATELEKKIKKNPAVLIFFYGRENKNLARSVLQFIYSFVDK